MHNEVALLQEVLAQDSMDTLHLASECTLLPARYEDRLLDSWDMTIEPFCCCVASP